MNLKLEKKWFLDEREIKKGDKLYINRHVYDHMYLDGIYIYDGNMLVSEDGRYKVETDDIEIVEMRFVDDKPYCQEDYEDAKLKGIDLDNWNDYVIYYELGSNNEE